MKALSPLFFAAIEIVLDLVAFFLSFVVLPARIGVDGVDTKLAFSSIVTSVYKHPKGPAGSKNNYLALTADATAK